jgi:hypothetical protein
MSRIQDTEGYRGLEVETGFGAVSVNAITRKFDTCGEAFSFTKMHNKWNTDLRGCELFDEW